LTSTLILENLISGILLGGIYIIMSLGLNLIFGVIKVVNFAHGEFLMLGMYITYWMFMLLGLDPYLSIPIAAALLGLLGMFVQKFIFNKLLADEASQIMAAIGLMIFFQNLATFLWGSDFKSVRSSYAGINISVFDVRISATRAISFIIAIIVTMLLYFFLNKTETGMKIRATAQDRELAEIMGINSKRIYITTFGIGAALCGIAAALMSPIYYVFPVVGFTFAPLCFVIVVLGGLGSFTGTIAGGFILGILEAFIGFLVNVEVATVVAFVILLIVLFWKPTGLFGER
jgi:branched-chain amino acid transport system permease protein